MAQVLNPRFVDPYQPAADDIDDEERNNDCLAVAGGVLDGPYAHLFVAKFLRDLQQSVNVGNKAYKNNKKMSYSSKAEIEDEPPTLHEPLPWPADHNLKSCMKKNGVSAEKKGNNKVSWAASVYDPTPSRESHLSNTIEWPKIDNKDKDNDKDKGGKNKDMKKKKKKKQELKFRKYASMKNGKKKGRNYYY